MLQPEVIAGLHQLHRLCQCQLGRATPFVDPAILADPAIYPDAETLSGCTPPAPRPRSRTANDPGLAAIKAG